MILPIFCHSQFQSSWVVDKTELPQTQIDFIVNNKILKSI